MSDNKQRNENREMVADILAEYRNDVDAMDRGWLYKPTTEYVRRLLDRIDAAWKRQEQCYLDQIHDDVNMIGHERFVAEHPSVGNAAAMREALENSNGLLEELAVIGEWGESAREQIAENNAAFSAPPRQCDVGTPYEQASRMRQFCEKQKMNGIINCGYCPIKHEYQRDCTLTWAQKPYESQEGGAK